VLPESPLLESRGDRPLKMTFKDQLKALIFFHLEEHVSGRHLIQVLKEENFAHKNIAPEDGIEKSSFFNAIKVKEQQTNCTQKSCKIRYLTRLKQNHRLLFG